MALKWVLLAAALVGGLVAVARTEPPASSISAATDSVAVAEVGMFERLRYSIGSVGTALVAGTVRRNVLETEHTLADMRRAIKEAKGSDGMRAREIVRKIRYADSLAVEHLYQGRPVQAVKQTMEAKSLLHTVRSNLKQQI